jgi:hypothetical protein
MPKKSSEINELDKLKLDKECHEGTIFVQF